MHPEYRELWEKAGCPRHMGSAAVVRPPPPEYLRVYYLTSSEHAISDIAFGRLKVARFSDLNDPFELLSLSFRDSPVRQRVRDFKEVYNEKIGLLCFSQNWTNPVLWEPLG